MKISAKDLEIIRNLAQIEIDNSYYDFHNDYDCIKIMFENNSLILFFKHIVGGNLISFGFNEAIIEKFDFFNFYEFKNLTIDTLYRGRFESNGNLTEFNDEGKSYFYLEFVEGANIELWCESIIVENIEKEN